MQVGAMLVTLLIGFAACADDSVSPLCVAAATGDVIRVKSLLAEGASVRARDKEGWSPLYWAAGNGHKEIVEILLANKANVNARDKDGWTSLYEAASRGRREIVELLLAHGADVNAEIDTGCTPLCGAAGNGHKEIVEMLLAHGANVNVNVKAKKGGWTPFLLAALQGHREVVEVLLAHGADVNGKTEDGWTPLYAAASEGHKEVVEVLLAKYRSEWPSEVLLTESTPFPVVIDGKQSGTVELSAGTKLKLIVVQGEQIKVAFNGKEQTIPVKATDLVTRVIRNCLSNFDKEKKAVELRQQSEDAARQQRAAEEAAAEAAEWRQKVLLQVQARIKAKAQAKWPDDFEMQAYEIKIQKGAYQTLQEMASVSGIPSDVLGKIKSMAVSKWPDDYEMQVYEIQVQTKAYLSLH
ncbi:MAG: ankyrin repeat domain-containing protein [Verrucomicrobiota bacterium]